MFRRFSDVAQLYAYPDGRVGRPNPIQVGDADGIDTYTTVDVPMNPEVTSVEKRFNAVLIVAKSERRLLSLACFKSSAGLRVRMTTTERMATRARTTSNSINVKDFRLLALSTVEGLFLVEYFMI